MDNKVYVDINNLRKNIDIIKSKTNKEIISVIKSNAYGLNAKYIYQYLKKMNINFFCVVNYEEFIDLIDFIDCPVLVLNSTSKFINSEYLRYTINNLEDLYLYMSFNKKITVHIQIDSGMNRQGIRTIEEYLKILEIIHQCKNITLEGIFTHYSSNYLENSYYNLQSSRFYEYLNYYDYKIIHTAASQSLNKNIIGNYIRIGLSMYGLCNNLGLFPVICLKTSVINTFFLQKDNVVGYGQDELLEDGYINIIPLGYSDCNDFLEIMYKKDRKWHNAKVFGKSCMNHRFIYTKIDNLIKKRIYIKVDANIDLYRFIVSLNKIEKIYLKTFINKKVRDLKLLLKKQIS